MSHTPTRSFTSLLLVLWFTIHSSEVFAGIKCWKNHEGIRECGNVVPPEFAQKRTQTLSSQGITVETQERAPTAEEVAERRAKALLEERQRKAEEKRRRQQEAYDNVLLASFTTERDLLISRDQKLAAVDANIELTYLSIEKLKKELVQFNRQAAMHERRRQAIPEKLTEDIERINQQIASKMGHISAQQERRSAYEEEYLGYMLRFRELKGGAAIGSTPPSQLVTEESDEASPRYTN